MSLPKLQVPNTTCPSRANFHDIMDGPTFRPTKEEFTVLEDYIEYVRVNGGEAFGIAKVIPPEGCKPPAIRDDSDVFSRNIDTLARQSFKQVGPYSWEIVQNDKEPMLVSGFKRQCELFDTGITEVSFEEFDKEVWSNMSYSSPYYGSDVDGTIFSDDFKLWNLNKLNTILDMIRNEYGHKIRGVQTSFLYFGQRYSVFPWHDEDCELPSISYLHYGSPKMWFGVPAASSADFIKLASTKFSASKTCNNFLRHKEHLIDPYHVLQEGVPVFKLLQNVGEYIIIFPATFHCGYNKGFNISESTNFAARFWIRYGLASTICDCARSKIPGHETVDINMLPFLIKYENYNVPSFLDDTLLVKHPARGTTVAARRSLPVYPKERAFYERVVNDYDQARKNELDKEQIISDIDRLKALEEKLQQRIAAFEEKCKQVAEVDEKCQSCGSSRIRSPDQQQACVTDNKIEPEETSKGTTIYEKELNQSKQAEALDSTFESSGNDGNQERLDPNTTVSDSIDSITTQLEQNLLTTSSSDDGSNKLRLFSVVPHKPLSVQLCKDLNLTVSSHPAYGFIHQQPQNGRSCGVHASLEECILNSSFVQRPEVGESDNNYIVHYL